MLKLYYGKGTAALAPHIALEISGLSYDAQLLDMGAAEQKSAAYAAINPKLRVPALVTDDGVLTEVPAILVYIAQIAPDADLAPTAPFAFAKVQEFNAYLCATVHVNHAHKMRGARWSDDPSTFPSMQAKVTQNMTDCARLIEENYLVGPWVLGSRFSIADIYLLVIARWMVGDGVDIDAFPKLAAHMAAMQARADVQKVLALHS